ncbi:unnamed protein product [Strongylus vulgaris]|uniref:Uncharacterized protein n=1 Tax=Strongylus vulgaris TaxID=40348 RepID=A0A3P7ITM1_STRVU|nr:unnamed protein product [Strongylus vulgaris]
MDWSYNEKSRRQMDPKNPEMVPREAKLPRGRPSTKWSDVFVTRMDELNCQLVTSNGSGPCERRSRSSIPTSWMKLARERNGWKQCSGLHDK